MPTDLFAGVRVTDYAASLEWYGRLFGSPPAFFPNASEAVWEVGEHRFVYIVQQPEHAGHSVLLLFVDDLDARLAAIAERGLSPAEQETYPNGVRKMTFRDRDGNDLSFGGS
jgi:catechol 2,3-dioxygenase-like lactoylglutathione lyase family enzyme